MLPNPDPVSDRVEVTHRSRKFGRNNLVLIAGLVIVLAVVAALVLVQSSRSALYPVKVNGKYGYINKSGKMIVAPEFDRASASAGGFAPAAMGRTCVSVDGQSKP